tara:strand:- start:2408 stop:3634 length:1227 start_codon:yes stop_codon:yes gene_type:complete
MAPTSLKAGAYLSYAAACCFALSGLCFLAGLGEERVIMGINDAHVDVNNHTQMVKLWEARRAGRPGYLAGDFFEVMGWLFVIPPVQATATMLGGAQRSATGLFTYSFIATAMINIVDFTFNAGAVTVTDSWSIPLSEKPTGVNWHPWRQDPLWHDHDDEHLLPGVVHDETDCDAACTVAGDESDGAGGDESGDCLTHEHMAEFRCAACVACHDHDGDGVHDHLHSEHDDVLDAMSSLVEHAHMEPIKPEHTLGASDDLDLVPWFTPLQSLELTYRMARSRGLWLQALDMLLLTIGLMCCAFLVSGTRALSPAWRNATILFVAFTAAGFFAGLAKAVEFGDSKEGILRPISGLYFLFVTAVLLPSWLVWLGREMAGNDGKEFGAVFSIHEEAKGGTELSAVSQMAGVPV